jgi:hypothetical protein
MARLQGVLQQLRNEHQRAESEVTRLGQAISAIEGLLDRNHSAPRRQRVMSAAARRRIAEAQRARWARARRKKGTRTPARAPRRTLSPAARRRIAAAQKARWAKFRAGSKG